MVQLKEKLQIEDLKEYCFLSSLNFSPDGEKKALLAKKANEDNGYYSVIYVDKGNGFIPLTSVKGNVSFYTWMDSDSIIFSELRDPKVKEKAEKGIEISSFYKININGGEATHLFNLDARAKEIKVLGENKFLVHTVVDLNRPDFKEKNDAEKEVILKELKKEKDYQVIDEAPFWFNGMGFINKLRERLNIYEPGQGLVPFTCDKSRLRSFAVSPCGKFVAYSDSAFEGDVLKMKENLFLYDVEKKQTKQLLDDKYYIDGYDFYGDKLVIGLSDGAKYNFMENPDLYLLDVSGNLEKIYEGDFSLGAAATGDCSLGGGHTFKVFGDGLYFTTLQGFHGDVYRLDLKTYELAAQTPGNGSVNMFDICEKGLIGVAFCDSRLQEVYTYNNGEYCRISSFNNHIHETKHYSEPEHFTFTDKDGFEIDGWVIPPREYDPNKKYPAILDIHGGPKAAFGDIYFHEMQYWAGENYFVLYSNPRGGEGKGNKFAEIRGMYGTVDYDNLMEFVDLALERYPAINPDKLGVTGGSYGGYMTNWIIGHTERFAAAASQRSISNWLSFNNVSDIGYYFGTDQMQADIWSDPEKLWWHSPIKYANKAKTPTLFIHSDQDYRCWVPEAYQMFIALKLHGVDSRMCIFHGENHELSRSGKPEHRVRRIKEITQWMDKYLKN